MLICAVGDVHGAINRLIGRAGNLVAFKFSRPAQFAALGER